jgi:hypothetical protein
MILREKHNRLAPIIKLFLTILRLYLMKTYFFNIFIYPNLTGLNLT